MYDNTPNQLNVTGDEIVEDEWQTENISFCSGEKYSIDAGAGYSKYLRNYTEKLVFLLR